MQKQISTLVGLIIIIAFSVVSFGGVFAYQYFFIKTQPTTQNPQQLIGGDKDAHGCLPSAGYTWCEVKQKCLRPWEEKCEATTDSTANWKTYTNTKFGYSIKYPTNWFINTQSSNLDLTDRASDNNYFGGDTSISNYQGDYGMNPPKDYTSISLMFMKLLPASNSNPPVNDAESIKKENVVINGMPAIKTTTIGLRSIGSPTKPNSVGVIFELNNGEKLSIGYGFDNNNIDAAKIADQIISTFKFTK